MLAGEEIEFALSPRAGNDFSKSFTLDLIAQLRGSKAQAAFGSDFVLRANKEADSHSLFLRNGCRVYADEISHLELGKYRIFEVATPEVTNCLSIVRYDKVAEKLASFAARSLFEDRGVSIECYKTSIATGATSDVYTTRGAHESYRVKKDFVEKLDLLIPFLVTRQLFCGQGGYYEHRPVMSPRQFFVERTIADVSTPVPMVCLRNKSLSLNKDYARIQVLNGEATRSQVSTFLRFAVTCLVMRCIEEGLITAVPRLEEPILAARSLSLACASKVNLRRTDGRMIRAEDLLADYYLTPIEELVCRGQEAPEMVTAVGIFRSVMMDLAEDRIESLANQIEWAIKLHLFEHHFDRYFESDSSISYCQETANNAFCAVTDPLFDELEEELGIGRLVGEDDICESLRLPPVPSRANARSEIERAFQGRVDGVGWEHMVIGGKKYSLSEDVEWDEEAIATRVGEIEASL